MLRLLILNHNDKEKGTFFRCFFIGKCLSKLGVDTSLSCLNPAMRQFSIRREESGGVKYFLITGQHGMNSFTELPFHIYRTLQNIYLIVSGRYDFIYFFNVVSPTIALPLIFLKLFKSLGILKTQVIIDWDDFWGKGGLTSVNKKGVLIELVADFLERALPKFGDRLTVASKNIERRALINGINPAKLYYLPNGANVDFLYSSQTKPLRVKLNLPIRKNILCFVGRVLWTFDYLIESFLHIVAAKPDTLLLYISPLKTSHLNQIKKLGLSKNVKFLGVQPYEKLSDLLMASDILLLPRIATEIEKLNSPARLGDYLAAGRPIVATAIGDEVEKVMTKFKCGLLAKPNDSIDFSKKVIELIDNKELREKIGVNNRLLAETKLSWNVLVKSFLDNVILES